MQNIPTSTVKMKLLEVGLKGCKAKKKPQLSQANKKKTQKFSKTNKNWTPNDWANIIQPELS